jgi:Carboxypeptidase regulatory-like domain
MRSTSKWLAGLALVLIAAVCLLLRQAPDIEAARSAETARDTSSPALPAVFESAASEAEPSSGEDALQPALLLESAGLASPLAAVTGRVVDERGAPVAGVRVFLLRKDLDDEGDEAAFDELTRLSHPPSGCVSAADGAFRLEQPADGECVLALAPQGGAAQIATGLVVLPGVTVALGDVLLRAPRTVFGYVSDESHQPIAGAEVLVTDQASFLSAVVAMSGVEETRLLETGVLPSEDWVQSFLRALPQSVLTTTAKDGRFEAQLVHVGDRDVEIAARAPGWTMAFKDLSQNGDGVVLRRATNRIAGRVASADGRLPPADTFVVARSVHDIGANVEPFGRTVRVAPDGRFTIEGLTDQTCLLRAEARDSRPSAPVEVAAGTSDARLVLRPPFEITVHVTLDGVALDEFDLALTPARRMLRPRLPPALRHAGPGAGGVLHITGVGADELLVQAFAGELCSQPQAIPATDERPSVEISLPLVPSREVEGVVRESNGGKPVAGALVGASVEGLPAPAQARALTDADGRFRLGPIPRGPCALQVKAAGFDELLQGVSPDDAAPIVVELTRRALVQVRPGPVLRDAMHRGRVTPTHSEFGVHAVSLDSHRDDVLSELRPNGAFFDGLAPGRYRLELGGSRSAEFTVERGELVTVEF